MTPLIVADDFSGACDAAARAARNGYSAAALLTPPFDAPGADLLALSTETRHAQPEQARRRIRALDLAGRILYKKMDSTLRGPWIDEVDELLLTTGYSQAIVCPAFPAQGRTVRDGWLWVHGRRERQIRCPFTVRDAETEEDLARVASEICSSILPVGSAGLALHVFPRPPVVASPPSLAAALGHWLVLVASEHPASQAQLRFLREAALPGVVVNPDSYPATVAGVFATGGETAARFLREVGAQGIAGLRELEPGIPGGRILGGRYNGTVMVTKAGGFGGADAIVQVIGHFV